MELYGWVLMSNHVHMIISASDHNKISDIIRDLKKYTSVHIARAIAANPQESRKQWMLSLFADSAMNSAKHDKFLFWQQNYHPIQVSDREMFKQKLNYIHENPVRAGIVFEAHHYMYSSAIDYCGGKEYLKIMHME